MDPGLWMDVTLTGVIAAAAILLLVALYVTILRVPRPTYNYRGLVLTAAIVALTFGAWAGLIRTAGLTWINDISPKSVPGAEEERLVPGEQPSDFDSNQ